MLSSGYIKNAALHVGFDMCGIARSRALNENETYFKRWLDEGRSGGLEYLGRNLDKRFDPSKLVEGAKSVVVCAVSYKNHVSDGYPEGAKAKIASYACAGDYHNIIKGLLRNLFMDLQRCSPTLSGRMFVDSAPILEKQFAVEAGLGWIGRQSLLVTRRYGTFVLLGELVLTEEVDKYDSPLMTGGCGECRRCVESCPVGAILPEHSIDAAKCISCATVEAKIKDADDIKRHNRLNGWIFGCDDCQTSCPYNRMAEYHRLPAFNPIFDPRKISPDDWISMDNEVFERQFGTTPLMRCGLDMIKHNLHK